MQENRVALFLTTLEKCYKHPEITTKYDTLEFLTESIIKFIPKDIYKVSKNWSSERKNDNHMSDDMLKYVLKDKRIPKKWRDVCKKIDIDKFSSYFSEIINDYELDLIDKTFQSLLESERFIHNKNEHKKIKELLSEDEEKCKFLSAIFLNSIMNSLGKTERKKPLDFNKGYKTKTQATKRDFAKKRFNQLLTEENNYKVGQSRFPLGNYEQLYEKIIEEITPEDAKLLSFFLKESTITDITLQITFSNKTPYIDQYGDKSNYFYSSCSPANKKKRKEIFNMIQALQNLKRLGIINTLGEKFRKEEISPYFSIKKNRLYPSLSSKVRLLSNEKQNIYFALHLIPENIRGLNRIINEFNYSVKENSNLSLRDDILSINLNFYTYALSWFGLGFLEYIGGEKLNHKQFYEVVDKP